MKIESYNRKTVSNGQKFCEWYGKFHKIVFKIRNFFYIFQNFGTLQKCKKKKFICILTN